MEPLPPPHLAVAGTAPGTSPVPILEVMGNAITGGMETWVGNLVGHLRGAPRRLAPEIVAPFSSRITERWLADGYPVHIAPIDDEVELMHSVERVVELVRRTGARLLHSHLANANAVCAIAAEICGVPALATLHGRQFTQRDLEAMQLGRAHALVVGEAALAQARLLGLGNRVTWIPNGVDAHRFRPGEERPEGDEVVVGYVGRFAYEKGPDDFLRMAALLRHTPCRFVLVGDGPMRPELAAQIERDGLDGRVRLAGVSTDMPAVYRAFDILVSSSHSEGSPLAILEAMACGLPVIATGVGGVTAIVCDDVTGRVVPPRAVDALADAVAHLAADRERRRAWGRAARERVVARYTLQARAREVADLIERLIADGAGRTDVGSADEAGTLDVGAMSALAEMANVASVAGHR